MKKVIKYTKSTVLFGAAVALVASLLTQLHASAANTVPGSNTLVSINNVNSQGGNGNSSLLGISSDGNRVLFQSGASNLASPTGGVGLYIRDIKSSATIRVDVSTAGVVASGLSSNAILSGSGRYVVFTSQSTNLIDGTTQPMYQTYIRDTQTGTTSLLTKDLATGSAQGDTSGSSSTWDYVTGVSDDGRFVTFDSTVLANRLVSSSIRAGYYDVLILDRSTDTWQTLDVPVSGGYQSVNSNQSRMSCDGSFVVFQSYASNLEASGSVANQIYLADLRNGTPKISRISSIQSTNPRISCNGNYITYQTKNRTDVTPTPSGMNSYDHLVKYDRISSAKSYIDSNSAGTTFNSMLYNASSGGASVLPVVSDTLAANITDVGDAVFIYSPGKKYIKHLSDGSGTLESFMKTSGGTYIDGHGSVMISANGKFTAYWADAYTLGLITASSGFSDIVRSATGL